MLQSRTILKKRICLKYIIYELFYLRFLYVHSYVPIFSHDILSGPEKPNQN